MPPTPEEDRARTEQDQEDPEKILAAVYGHGRALLQDVDRLRRVLREKRALREGNGQAPNA
jgi:hypothetical protein